MKINQYSVVCFFPLLLFLFGKDCKAQSLGLNNPAPDASSILDLTAINRGLLIPRMTTAQRVAIAAPANGLLVFDTDFASFYYYDATPVAAWRPLLADSKSSSVSGWSTLGNTGTSAATNFLGTTDGIDLVFKTAGAERLRIYNGNGLAIAPLAAATSTAIDIGALSGATANTGINIGAISGAGTATAINTNAISSTGATAYHINLGDLSGANATSHTGINIGNISGVTPNAYGINLGTLTGGTTANFGINLGAVTSTGATNSYGLNIGVISGSGTNTFGINIDALTSTGTSSTGINVAGLFGAGLTNTGLLINTISGGTTNNFGLKVTGTAAAATNFGLYVDAPAKNYFLGQVGINQSTPDASSLLDIASTDKGVLVPRMTTAERTGIVIPANGLFVFDTDQKTFYYYDGPAGLWRSLYSSAAASSLTAWSISGNAGIIEGADFLGTLGAVDLTMRANNLERFRVNFDDGPEIAPLAFANSTGLKIGALTGATSNKGIDIGTLTGATNTGISIGAFSGTTANTGVTIGAISGTGTASAFTSNAISSTGATAYHLNLGDISGANATSHTGINLGNISGVTPNAFGLNIGTLTGGTTANTAINVSDITSTGAAGSYSLKTGILSGTGAVADHINLGAITGANTTSHSAITVGNISGATPNAYGLNIGTLTGGTTANTAINVSDITSTGAASSYSLKTGILSGTGAVADHINLGTITGANTTSHSAITVGNISGATPNAYGLNIGTLTGGTTANFGINLGDITTTGAAGSYSLKTGILSGTGAVADHINLGSITGDNTTSHSAITVGNISGATPNAYGLNIGTLTGGTTANYGINLGALTSTGAANSYGLNIGAISGSGTNTFGINVAALTSTGTASTGINIGGLSGAGLTNTGLLINTISGGITNNFGLRVTGTAAAATNFGLYVDAPVKNYFLGQVGINQTTPDASSLLDIASTDKGVLIPRMTTAQRTAIAAPSNGLLVFDTDLKTFYYYDGPATLWRSMYSSAASSSLTAWSISGNAGIIDGTDYLGTTGAVDLDFRTNATERMTIDGTNGNVGINQAAPDASSMLDIVSTSKGVLIPRMTTAQKAAIASPVNGLTVFDTDRGTMECWDATLAVPAWRGITGTPLCFGDNGSTGDNSSEYYPLGANVAGSGTASNCFIVMPRAGLLKGIYVNANSSTLVNGITFTVWKGATVGTIAATALAVTLAGAATTGNNTTLSVAVNAGDVIVIQAVAPNGAGATQINDPRVSIVFY